VPDRVALISGDESRTYAEMARRVRRCAHGLRSLGVSRGDRVAWLGSNHPAFLESFFAAGTLGAVMTPVNHRLPGEDIAWMLGDSGASVLVLDASLATTSVPPSIRTRVAIGGPVGGAVDYEAMLAEGSEEAIDEPIGLDDLGFLPYTSGTTGRPKGVMLTHGNMTWNVLNLLSCADFRSDDVTVAIAPFFRVGGTGVNVLPVMFKGGTVVVPGAFDPDELLGLIERHRITVGFGNPDVLQALSRSPRWPDADLSSIRFVVTGGAPVPEPLIRTFLARGISFLPGYGLSEAGPVALLLDEASMLRKVGSAGKPPLFVDIRVVRADLSDVGPGETGELLVRGPNVMAGYWDLPEVTRETLSEEGWLRTGDAVRLDDEGYVWIVDRVQDAFTSGDRVVYPGEVERVLATHPGVADSGVVGVRGGSRGETGVAFVVLQPSSMVTEEQLLAFCRERLDPGQVPASVTFVDSLPRNTVGKLIRSDLRRELGEPPPS
jgi:acyl-CoA synthetase (AMP-forming)/AMP-acid ligase II